MNIYLDWSAVALVGLLSIPILLSIRLLRRTRSLIRRSQRSMSQRYFRNWHAACAAFSILGCSAGSSAGPPKECVARRSPRLLSSLSSRGLRHAVALERPRPSVEAEAVEARVFDDVEHVGEARRAVVFPLRGSP